MNNELVCQKCKGRYPIETGIPILLPGARRDPEEGKR